MLCPGKNCWCVDRASRCSVIVDGAAYFAAFAEACRNAKREIFIVGWDFDRRTRLHSDGVADLPDELGAFLKALVNQRKELRVRLLSWDFNMVYAAERELLPALKLKLQAPRRFHFRLDGKHPTGASHHQKIVVIDNRIAFVGGIDLTNSRWDTPAHRPNDPRRMNHDGKPYRPFHDVTMLVEGPIAARLGELARGRWRRAGGTKLQPPDARGTTPWPESIEPQLRDVAVGIARTEPAYHGRPAITEIKRLYLDTIAQARKFIYIENQYFTARTLGRALGERLAEERGPEVILVLPKSTGGWLEKATMDVLRSRVIADMSKQDKHGRLHVYYPHQPGLGGECISVHSKLMVVDDRLLRIGSSNTSNRSMGLDTECDLVFEGQNDSEANAFVTSVRRGLLAEHLDCPSDRVAEAESVEPTLVGAIEALCHEQRSLRPLDWQVPEQLDEALPDSGLIDPPEPLSAEYFVSRYVPNGADASSKKHVVAFVLLIIALLMLAASWRFTPLSDLLSPETITQWIKAIPWSEAEPLMAIAGFVVGTLLMVPLLLLAVAAGILFDAWTAFAYAFSGAMTSAAVGFLVGRLVGRGAIERLGGSRLLRLSQGMAQRGVTSVTLLRLLPIAPFTVFNLIAGASHLPARPFFLGSALGLLPGLAGITFFSSTLWQAISTPSIAHIAIAGAVGALLIGMALLARRWLRSG